MDAKDNKCKAGRPHFILIVEDEALIAMELKSIVEDNGYFVSGVSSSVTAALNRLETDRPDLTLLDANLRGESSSPVAARLRVLGIPFVMCSAYSSFAFDQTNSFTNAPHLCKPIAEQDLLRVLEEILV